MTEPSEHRRVVIPYKPRSWAKPFHASFKRWSCLVLHRRAGKTTAILNHHQRAALDDNWERRRLQALMPDASPMQLAELMKHRTYWHVMPSYRQGKLTGAWDILKEISSVVPGVRHNESEMLAAYPNGHKVQIIGADKPDSLRGPGLSGVSLDEYSQILPNVFGEILSKALADHLGFAIFSGTIKGQDHLYKIHERARQDDAWFSLWRDIDTSLAEEEGPTIEALRLALEDDRKLVLQGLMTQAEYDQEWYLSVEAAIKGAFFAAELAQARKDGRITAVPYEPSIPVDTDWDLGIDAMAVWFSQAEPGGVIRMLDYEEDVGGGLLEMIKRVKGKPYVYGEHWAPHDIEQRTIANALTLKQIAAQHGFDFQVTPRIAIADGITAAQLTLSRCWFDETKCKNGLEALRHYRRKLLRTHGTFSAEPEHDWSSHGADAFRGMSVRAKSAREMERPRRSPPAKMPREWNWA